MGAEFPCMQYLVSFALLVAVCAWMVGVYNHLLHLRSAVCNCWSQWLKAAHQRNECLNDFTAAFVLFMPQGDPLPRSLRRLRDDSERSLSIAPEPRWSEQHGFVNGAELLLRQTVARSLQEVEESSVMRSHEHLQRLCSRLNVSLYQQDQFAALFNHAVSEYNEALKTPSARLLAPLFGFMMADTIGLAGTKTPAAPDGAAGAD